VGRAKGRVCVVVFAGWLTVVVGWTGDQYVRGDDGAKKENEKEGERRKREKGER
jgi:hypothetical protein